MNISEGEISEEEKGKMTESMKTVCGDKTIEKITVMSTSANTFKKLANGGIISLPVTNQRTRLIVKGCANFKLEGKTNLHFYSLHFQLFRKCAVLRIQDTGAGHMVGCLSTDLATVLSASHAVIQKTITPHFARVLISPPSTK